MKTSLILNDHKDSELEREVEFSYHIVTVVMFRQHLTLKEIFTIKTLSLEYIKEECYSPEC